MKTPKTAFAVGYIDDDLIRSAEKRVIKKKMYYCQQTVLKIIEI